jgi:hypothetical protein
VTAERFFVTLLLCAAVLMGEARAQTPPPETVPPAPIEEEAPPPEPPPPLSRAPDRVPLINLSQIETERLRILFFAPAQTYLTPYVGRSLENALRYNQERFGWEPWDRVTLLLKDFSDYGNAAARASPNNALLLDVAPLSLAFETFSPGERFTR